MLKDNNKWMKDEEKNSHWVLDIILVTIVIN
jgi:hypothetical protein